MFGPAAIAALSCQGRLFEHIGIMFPGLERFNQLQAFRCADSRLRARRNRYR